jgi:hypothetical protein
VPIPPSRLLPEQTSSSGQEEAEGLGGTTLAAGPDVGVRIMINLVFA